MTQTKILTTIPWFFAAAVLVCAAHGQQAAPGPEPPHVYVVDFERKESDPHFADLSTFLPNLIRLQLLEVPTLVVSPRKSPPPCGETGRVIAPNFSQSAPAVGEKLPNDFFIISGSIKFVGTDIRIEGSLDRCQNNQSVHISSNQTQFVAAKALEEVTILTQFLVYKLESLLPATQVYVAAIQAANKKLEPIAAQLTEQIKIEMTQHPGLRLSDSRDATVVIDGDLSKTGNDLVAALRIRWGEVPKPLNRHGTADDVPGFLRETGKFVYDTLAAEVTANSFGSSDYLDKQDPQTLVKDAKALLCVEQAPNCRPDRPDAALRLLEAAVGRSSDRDHPDPNWVYLLAMAQSANLQNQDAIATLKRAQSLNSASANPSRQLGIDILNQLGKLYTQGGDSSAAVASYSESLAKDSRQADIYLRKADVVFASNPVQAIRMLLDALDHAPKSSQDEIRDSIREDIAKLRPGDREAVAGILQAALPKLPVTEEYAEVCASAAADLSYADPSRAESYLQRVEALPQNELTKETRNWMARMQAFEYMQQKDFEHAYNSNLAAQNILDDSFTQSQRSNIEVAWAESLKTSDPAKAADLLKKAYERSKPLVLEGKPEAYNSFVSAGHSLDDFTHTHEHDQVGQQVFAKLLAAKPDDIYAAWGLAFICGEYLGDLQCSYSAAATIMTTPRDDVELQIDAVEAAVLTGHYEQAKKWLAIADQHPEADIEDKAVANFYRFWMAFVQDEAFPKQDFQHLLTSLSTYDEAVKASPSLDNWAFNGARKALESSGIASDKKDVLIKIIDAFEHPGSGTTALTQLAQRF